MNLYFPQSYEAYIELVLLSSTEALIKSCQSSNLLLNICQDSLTAGYLLTCGSYKYNSNTRTKEFVPLVYIEKSIFTNALMQVGDWELDYIFKKMLHIKEILEWKNIKNVEEYMSSGHCLLSFLLPNDFEYNYNKTNVVIIRGVILSGTFNKMVLSDGPTSIPYKLEKEYGAKITIDFVSYYQFMADFWIRSIGFSIGIEDCMPSQMTLVKDEITKSFIEAQGLEIAEKDEDIRERKITHTLNNATSVGQKLSTDILEFDNSLNIMVNAGSKGSVINISQIKGLLGQQNINGERIPITFGERTLPYYPKKFNTNVEETTDDMRKIMYESRGFTTNSYMSGLNPREFFFHAAAGRIGVIDTSIKTASSGYIQRKLVKKMEDFRYSYLNTVVNSKGSVVQFNYQNNFDPVHCVKMNNSRSFINIKNIVDKLNTDYEYEEYKNNKNSYKSTLKLNFKY